MLYLPALIAKFCRQEDKFGPSVNGMSRRHSSFWTTSDPILDKYGPSRLVTRSYKVGYGADVAGLGEQNAKNIRMSPVGTNGIMFPRLSSGEYSREQPKVSSLAVTQSDPEDQHLQDVLAPTAGCVNDKMTITGHCPHAVLL